VVKGVASVYGGNQNGTAMIDGFYAKGNEITKGKWFTWSWGQGKNPGEIEDDFGGLYADYDFNKEHGWMARDVFGATWGYLVNGAKIEILKNRTAYKSSLMQAEAVIQSLQPKVNLADSYAQCLIGYLVATETGDYTFWIAADDEGEFWLGGAASSKADKRICYTSEYVGAEEWGRRPSQKSAPVRLEKGKAYPIMVLHAEGTGDDHVSVAWTKPGSDKPEVIGGAVLSVTADGKQPGVRQRVWGDVGKIADLLKRPDYPEGRISVDDGALSLNGKDQFVELQKDVADMAECTYTAELKWSGGNDGARVFEFANANGDAMWLSPSEKGKLVFAIRKGKTVEQVSAPALKKGEWASVRVILAGKSATLYVNGKKAAENSKMTLTPDSVRATQCYLGRGLNGGYFNGQIGRFTIHSVALTSTTPVAANP